VGIAPGGHPGA